MIHKIHEYLTHMSRLPFEVDELTLDIATRGTQVSFIVVKTVVLESEIHNFKARTVFYLETDDIKIEYKLDETQLNYTLTIDKEETVEEQVNHIYSNIDSLYKELKRDLKFKVDLEQKIKETITDFEIDLIINCVTHYVTAGEESKITFK